MMWQSRARAREPGARIAAIDNALRRVRLLAALFAMVAALTRPDSAAATEALQVAIAVAITLLVVNALSLLADRSSAWRERALVASQITLESALGLAVVLLAGGVEGSFRWALLLLPLLHAALRYQITGVAAVWGGLSTVFLFKAAWEWNAREGLEQLTPILQPLAVLLFVGLAVGYLAAQLVTEIADQRGLGAEAVRRAELLSSVTAATRQMISTDQTAIAASSVESILTLGFDYAEILEDAPGDPEPTVLAAAGVEPADEPDTDGFYPAPAETQDLDGDWSEEDEEQEEAAPTATVSVRIPGTPWVLRAVGGIGGGLPRQQAFEIVVAATGHAWAYAERVRQADELRAQLAHELAHTTRDTGHDALTGLLSRSGLRAQLEERLAGLDPGSCLPVFLIDLDDVESVRETLGSDVVNDLLRDAAGALSDMLPSSALVARVGADEFVVALTEMRRDGLEVGHAEQYRMELARTLTLRPRGGGHAVTASVGMHLATSGDDIVRCLRTADADLVEDRRGRGGTANEQLPPQG